MKRVGQIISAAVCLSMTISLYAAPSSETATTNWMRYPSISPDGKQIAFSFHGDLWVVGANGGDARILTTHGGYERSPVWSPDGKTIAFMADWYGNGDVFIVPVQGGVPKRLTYHSSGDEPSCFSSDGKFVLFSSHRLDAPNATIGTAAMGELYKISIDGGRPTQLMTTPAHNAKINAAGDKVVFHDYKGYEDEWRKHHISSVTRDIWIYDVETGVYQKLSGFSGEDRNPVWASDEKAVYYLSEQMEPAEIEAQNEITSSVEKENTKRGRVIPQPNSSFNIWKVILDDPTKQERVTSHKTHPVRFLSSSNSGVLCYGYNGEIWTKNPNAQPQRIEINCGESVRANETKLLQLRNGATEFTVSPNEEEVAFVVRGEVFVANVEFGTTKRVTDTPTQERSLSWSKDGHSLYYAGERKHSWNIYRSAITRDDELGFANATLITEEPVIETDDETFQPVCSPDGKKLAYLRNRRELMILDLETRKSSTLLAAERNFAYRDGDISYDWSPDSKWLVTRYFGQESWIEEVGLINLASGEITNMSQSGYVDASPMFASNGSAILYATDRFGQRSQSNTQSEMDVFAVYLTQSAFDKANMGKEELALAKKRDKEKEESKTKKSGNKQDDPEDKPDNADEDDSDVAGKSVETDGSEDEEIEPVKIELDDFEYRRRRLTLHSSSLFSFDLSPDGEHLIYVAQVDDKTGVWLCNVRDRSTNQVHLIGNEMGDISFSNDGKSAFLRTSNGSLSKLDLAAAFAGNGKAIAKPIAYLAEMNLAEAAERAYVFEHAWRQVKRKFYDESLHGVDWDSMKSNYTSMLPSITNNHDFAEMLGEMLGELNASHTGCRFRPSIPDSDSTASLGLIYDTQYNGIGLKISEVLKRGPCDSAESKLQPGTVITHINGERLVASINPWCLLNRQANRPVRLTLSHPEDQSEWEEVVRPVSSEEESNLLYQRWIDSRRAFCEKLSDGKIGYVHVQGMNDTSMRRVYNDVLGVNHGKQALIVDTRFNGGGCRLIRFKLGMCTAPCRFAFR